MIAMPTREMNAPGHAVDESGRADVSIGAIVGPSVGLSLGAGVDVGGSVLHKR
jgi:hypothetical protein